MQLIKTGEWISINGKEVSITSVQAEGDKVKFGIKPSIAGCENITISEGRDLKVVYDEEAI